MAFYASLSALDSKTGLINVVVDAPKGSRGKYKYDEKTGIFHLSKMLPLGAYFPYNYGFIPGTRAEDGDALDMLVLMDEPVSLGSVLPVRLIGAMKAQQKERDGKSSRNDRLIGVIETQYNPPEIVSVLNLTPQHLLEMEHFFISYNAIEGRHFSPLGCCGVEEADIIVKNGIDRYGVSAKAA